MESCQGDGFLTWLIEIDGIRCRLVLLLDSGHVEYCELGLESLAPDPVRYQHERVHLMMVVCEWKGISRIELGAHFYINFSPSLSESLRIPT